MRRRLAYTLSKVVHWLEPKDVIVNGKCWGGYTDFFVSPHLGAGDSIISWHNAWPDNWEGVDLDG